MRALQQRRQVQRAAHTGGGLRRRRARDRPLRPGRAATTTGRVRLLPRTRRRQGPELFPVLADPGPARAARRSRSAAWPRTRCAPTPAGSAWPPPTSPTARRSASCPTATTRRSSSATTPALATVGAIVDQRGAQIGAHGGVHRFTIGQRKGLGLSLGVPLYVVDIDAASAARHRRPARGAGTGDADRVAGELDRRRCRRRAGSPSPRRSATGIRRRRGACVRSTERAPSWSSRPPRARSPRDRPPSGTTATRCSAAAGSTSAGSQSRQRATRPPALAQTASET